MTLLALLLGLPLVEIAGFVLVGPWLGVGGTLAAVLLSAVIGVTIIRRQGLATLDRIHTAMSRGETPLPAMLDGALILLAGALFILPGFASDLVALCLLVPQVRRGVAVLVARAVRRRSFRRRAGEVVTIEGEFSELRPRPEGDGAGDVPGPRLSDSRWGRS